MDKVKLITPMVIALVAFLLAGQTCALVPYNGRSILDMMFPREDPFKILEQSPLANIPRGGADENAVALARADWRETPSEHQISLDIPGMKKDDIKIEVEDNRLLRVSGERKTEEEVKDERWHRVESTVGKFWRQFTLPGNADMENVSARLEDGVLRITVPKLADLEKKREAKVISIENGKSGSGMDKVVKHSKQEL